MPIYVYVCSACEERKELVRTLEKRDDPATCKKCGATMQRTLSANVSFTFRASIVQSGDATIKPRNSYV